MLDDTALFFPLRATPTQEEGQTIQNRAFPWGPLSRKLHQVPCSGAQNLENLQKAPLTASQHTLSEAESWGGSIYTKSHGSTAERCKVTSEDKNTMCVMYALKSCQIHLHMFRTKSYETSGGWQASDLLSLQFLSFCGCFPCQRHPLLLSSRNPVLGRRCRPLISRFREAECTHSSTVGCHVD